MSVGSAPRSDLSDRGDDSGLSSSKAKNVSFSRSPVVVFDDEINEVHERREEVDETLRQQLRPVALL